MMRTALLVGVLLVSTVHLPWSSVVSDVEAKTTHQVTGQVIARVTQEQPNTIVVSLNKGAAEMIVGAIVGEEVSIRRGKRPIRLAQIRVGEIVQLTYVKTSGGLVAVSIVAK